MRLCPICISANRELIHALQLTGGEWQTIYACTDCGMTYATVDTPADYRSGSIYAAPAAVGSGVSDGDKKRFISIATRLVGAGIHCNAPILDVGCASGGLLDALLAFGFTNTIGIDPSPACVRACQRKGHNVSAGTIGDLDLYRSRFSVITLSHVLEHLIDPVGALCILRDKLDHGGILYVEVPDASRYLDYDLPFVDFNSEHINHFTPLSLSNALKAAGLDGTNVILGELKLNCGLMYPTMSVLTPRKKPRKASYGFIQDYVGESAHLLSLMDQHLERQLEGHKEVTLWGAGSYLGNVLAMPAIRSRQILQVVDRMHHGRWLGEQAGSVVPPSALMFDAPIVIASLVAIESIKADIAAMGLTNKVVTLETI